MEVPVSYELDWESAEWNGTLNWKNNANHTNIGFSLFFSEADMLAAKRKFQGKFRRLLGELLNGQVPHFELFAIPQSQSPDRRMLYIIYSMGCSGDIISE